jgi:hypothetical protein
MVAATPGVTKNKVHFFRYSFNLAWSSNFLSWSSTFCMRYAIFSSNVALVAGASRVGGCGTFQTLGFGGTEGLGGRVGRGGVDGGCCIYFGMERNTKK